MQLRLIWVGKTKNRHLAALEEDYLKRIRRYISCEKISVAEVKKSDRHSRASALNKEGNAVLKKVPRNAFLIALDESGVEITSHELADMFQKQMLEGTQEIVLIGNGYYGMPAGLDESLNLRLSLSRFTLPHELARVVLLEQVYRAFCLINGMPYHK